MAKGIFSNNIIVVQGVYGDIHHTGPWIFLREFYLLCFKTENCLIFVLPQYILIMDYPATKNKTGEPTQKLLSRGIQTMLRLTSDNHLELSGMADGKANILISVNAIIISVILTVLIRRLETDPYLTIPTIIFLSFSVATMVISILTTRPKISQGIFNREDIMNKKTNLLFFGNFHKASLEEYEWGMRQMMRDQDYLYGALIKDIHQLGVVLGRKYRLLRLAYTVFMVGIIASVIAFALAVFIYNTPT